MSIYEEADLYCAAFDFPVEEEVQWLLKCYPRAKSVIEPFCGQARYASHFAARGLTYVGFDLAGAMLAKAPRGERITILEADARDFVLPNRPAGGFDLAWCPVNSISHLVLERDVISHFQCVKRHLSPTGDYVIELPLVRYNGRWRDPTGMRSTWSLPQPDGTEIQASWQRLRCDSETRTCTERATFRRLKDGDILGDVSEEFTMRMWTHDDLTRLAGEGGFSVADHAVVHRDFRPGPSARLSARLENTGLNYFFFLKSR